MLHRSALVDGPSAGIRQVFFGPDFSYLLFAAIAALIVLAVRLLDAIAFDFVAARRKHVVAPLLLREIISIALYAVLFSYAVSWIFGYSVSGLLATTTVVAAVIGLALQDTLGNLFSGIALHLEKTFEVGDSIRSGDHVGVVERVNWRSARLRTVDNTLIVLPNSLISRERIEVIPRLQPIGRVIHVGVTYGAEPGIVIPVLERAAATVAHVVTMPPPIGRVFSFGDSSVVYELKYWIDDFPLRDNIDSDVRRVTWYALRRHDLVIPFPIRTIRLAEESDPRADEGIHEVLERLKEVDLLAPLSEEEHRELAESTKVLNYARGEAILRRGESGDSMFIVHRGSVSVRLSESGTAKELARLGVGDIFGEMALLTGESRSADVVASSDVAVLEVGKASLHHLLTNDPDLVDRLSVKIIARRQELENSSTPAAAEETRTLVGRIRSWFRL